MRSGGASSGPACPDPDQKMAAEPDMDAIAALQSEETNLSRQLAARRYFQDAKRLQRGGSAVVSLLAFSSPFVLLAKPDLGPLLAAFAGLWIFLARFVFERFKRDSILEGVVAQEAFDCAVLGISWNDALAQRPAPEDIHGASQHVIDQIDDVRGWYPTVVSALWPTSVLICQRANAVWARRQHRAYARFLAVAVVVWFAIGIIVSVADSATLVEYLTIIALPSLPALLDTSELSKGHAGASLGREVLEHQTGDLLREGGANRRELREIQDQLFDLRRDGPLVPEWFYKRRRENYEEAMRKAATDLVGEVDIDGGAA
jgi:hypothetical protein